MAARPIIAARVEDRLNRVANRLLDSRGWQESILAFTGYGNSEQLRILARIVMRPSEDLGIVQAAQALLYRRGWRNFMNAAKVDARLWVVIDDTRIPVQADRGGYIDVRVRNPGLQPGWHNVRLEGDGGSSALAPVQVIGDDTTFGIVSDIDDTIITTLLPRPMLAAWNSFVLTEQARQAVPGMARLYQQLLTAHPGAPIVFVSTGSWNTYPMIQRFMTRHGIPRGAILFTDWGPTQTSWFRSGVDHKRRCLRELARDLPHISWLLVGDDGQHDPDLYAEFASLQPGHVRARAIRQLTPGEHTLAHGLPMEVASDARWQPDTAPEVRAPDGDGLAAQMNDLLAPGR
ncbi:Phosphatidate phosphatase APP1 [Tessaracoccus bendigoensis DSM 12906]|uniref:Phosphatidate phosphatase APP1 n=1 Tax=Tessaracoccus bendigoensis DSM 12906 TaxID=1123357 RepID=A0A1M6MJS3_9ACTN|nr:phosphatase domain-containing protein [Tessaracoccus bendigoensis]SHJ83644.1 Phosphatidate phosphatase APP1 [Tessaracoccus bendigoensis DSM 12906]